MVLASVERFFYIRRQVGKVKKAVPAPAYCLCRCSNCPPATAVAALFAVFCCCSSDLVAAVADNGPLFRCLVPRFGILPYLDGVLSII